METLDMTSFDDIRPLLEATDQVAVTPEDGDQETYDGTRLASMFETVIASDVTDLAAWTVTDTDQYPSLTGNGYTITVEAVGQTIDYEEATDRYHNIGTIPGAAIEGDEVYIPVNGEPAAYELRGTVPDEPDTYLEDAVYHEMTNRFGIERTIDG